MVIVGNGVAGVTAARHIRKRSDHRITIVSGESDYFYSRPALMYIFMGHMEPRHAEPYDRAFWAKNRIDLKRAWVTAIDHTAKNITCDDGTTLAFDKLVIATGSKSNFFGWPGQDLDGVQGLYSLQDLSLMEQNVGRTRRAVIVGGGLIGIEMAEMLSTRGVEVEFLVREPHYWGNILRREEALLVQRHMAEHHVKVHTETQLSEILGDESGRVKAVLTDKGDRLECQFVGITAGVHPNIEWVQGSAVETARGILVNRYLETNVPDVYAAGDCAQIRDGSEPGTVEQLWYTGRMQGETLAATICGERTAYERGIWFNSAKFFDIEYHTYGMVAPQEAEGENSFCWEHGNGKQLMRLVYRQDDQLLVGMNAFGMRYRHEVFERWLREGRTLSDVLENLEEANFEPEFFKRFERDMIEAYNQAHPQHPPLRFRPKRKWLLGLGA